MLEINQWAAYRHRRGSLNIARRIEQAAGNIMAFIHNTKVQDGRFIEPLELMPHEDDVVITFEEQMTG